VRDSYSANEVTKIEDQAYEVGKTAGLREGQEEAFQKGMAHAHEIVYQNIERMQQSLSDVMGIYMDMPSKLTQDHPSVAELEMGWRVLDQFKERFVDDYDDEFRKHNND
jgi:hypothetical protein